MISRTYTISEIIEVISPGISSISEQLNYSIDQVSVDSRINMGEDTLFFALRTSKNDGHKYINDAYKKGVRCFVVEESFEAVSLTDSVVLTVESPIRALQQLATFHRSKLNYPVLAITGSNGKTVIKEWLFQLLLPHMKVVKSPKSYNSQIGVPISILSFPINADLAIVEAGISHPGEMEILESIIKPDIGILSNINEAHIENFENREHILAEKSKLFANAKTLIARQKDIEMANDSELEGVDGKLFWSFQGEGNKASMIQVSKSEDSSELNISNSHLDGTFTNRFRDYASIENVIHCVVAAKELGISDTYINEGLSTLSQIPLRLEQLSGINNCTIINDAYNSDIISLEMALQFGQMQKQHQKTTLILSDIVQSGLTAEELYKRVNTLCKSNEINRIIGVGTEISSNETLFSLEKVMFNSVDELMSEIQNITFENEIVIVKGARKFELERVSDFLTEKKHETTLNINLSALIDNLSFYKTHLNKGVKIMGMVKAFSYGTGSFEISNVLVHHGVDYLTVAYLDEGIELRKHGITKPIMVMNPTQTAYSDLWKYDLEPEVFSINSLNLLAEKTIGIKSKLGIHIKVETGMNRLGFELEEVDELKEILARNSQLEVKSVFSHLVASDDPKHDDFTTEQFSRYDLFCEKFEGDYLKHILNSDGIIRHEDYQLNMVRLGIGMYGISSVDNIRKRLRNVLELKSVISQLKKVSKGESIGYGRSFVAERDMSIATIPIGYADGLSRKLGNGNWSFEINGKKAPIVGNVCMDMCMVDVSDIDDVQENQSVTLLKGNDSIYKMAKIRNTIPYEILTSFSQRIKRVFHYGE